MTRPENFTPRQRAEIFRRADGKCQECGRRLGVGGERWEAHHATGVWEGGRADVENGRALCAVPCHAALTGEQAGQRAEARRHERKQAGIRKQPRNPLAGSRASKWKRKMDGTVVER